MSKSPVLVTGATGYVAGWLVKKLLAEGYTVHAPVRDPDNADKVAHLKAMEAESPGTLKFFQAADLLDEGVYDEPMKGCDMVFHTASPFVMSVKDPQRDLVDPALKGTQNVLNSVNRTDSVKRVVLTSSAAAIFSDNVDFKRHANGVLTEEDWNTGSSVDHNPYQYSKTVAEQAAWALCEAQDRWDMVTINPSLVIGPGTNPNATSESFTLFRQFGNGKLATGVPKIDLGVVDVREVATAHYNAAFTPEAKGRHILSGHNTSMLALGKAIGKRFPKAPVPKNSLPKALVWAVAPAVGYSRKFIADNVGHTLNLDNSKSVRELGIKYRPLEESAGEFFQQLVDQGKVKG
jgi:nucleoside-diphosphate-sugar epimerase